MKLSIGKAWEETSAFLGKEARLVAPVALATFALPAVLMAWAYPAGPGSGGLVGLLLLLAVLVAAMLGQMTIALLAIGWSGRVGEAMGKVARRLLSLLGAGMIVFLPLIIVAIIAFGMALAGSGITNPSALTPATLLALPNIRWMSVLLVLIFLVLWATLFPIAAVAAIESPGPLNLLRRTWALTRGNVGRLLLLVLLLMLASVVLRGAVTMVVGSIATLAVGEPRAFNLSALIVALASGLVGAIVQTVSAAMVGRVYAQLAEDTKS